MDPRFEPLFLSKHAKPLPIIGVRRAMTQTRAHDDSRCTRRRRLRPRIDGALARLSRPGGERVVFRGAPGGQWIRGLSGENADAPEGWESTRQWTPVDSCGLGARSAEHGPVRLREGRYRFSAGTCRSAPPSRAC